MIVNSKLRLDRSELRKKDAEKLLRKLSFVTPKQDVVTCYRLTLDKIILPRGAWSEIPGYVE